MLFTGDPQAVAGSYRQRLGFLPGYAVHHPGPWSIMITRRFTPTWAIVVAVAGALFFLLGLLALLAKETDTLTITFYDAGNGTTKVVASGLADPRLQQLLHSMGGQPTQP